MNEYNVDWRDTHWTDGLSQELIDVMEFECERQGLPEHVGRDWLRTGWETAKGFSIGGGGLTLDQLLTVAGAVEPSNKGMLRQTPVTFAAGGFAVAAGVVPRALDQLLSVWPGVTASDDEKNWWLREFLVVHPFSDGNGRTAWVLQQWLFSAWAEPQRLPYYNFN